jgi:hypothetical protein
LKLEAMSFRAVRLVEFATVTFDADNGG